MNHLLTARQCVVSGYRYVFFDEDADIASRVLKIVSYVKTNGQLRQASIPTPRLFYHLRRLVIAGYKVGVVRQTETAALKKVSASKSKTFTRKLDKVYTRATFVGDESGDAPNAAGAGERGGEACGGYLMLLREAPDTAAASGQSGAVQIEFVALQTATGEIVYDSFTDTFLRTELDTRLQLLAPKELLLPPQSQLSAQTRAVVASASGYSFDDAADADGCKRAQSGAMRVEQLAAEWFDDASARTVFRDYCVNCDERALRGESADDADLDVDDKEADDDSSATEIEEDTLAAAAAAADKDVEALADMEGLSFTW